VGSHIGEGLVEKAEIASRGCLAESLVKVNSGHIITSILTTRKQDIDLPNSVVKVVELRDHDMGETTLIVVAKQEKGRDDPGQSRGERVIAQPRTDHMNNEEKSLHKLCFAYQDFFFFGGGGTN